MRARVLPPEEWGKLAGKGFDGMLPLIEPQNATVLVVEDGEQIVAHLGVLQMIHLESLWVHPDYRNAGVGRRLLRAIRATLRPFSKRWVMAQVSDARVCSLVQRLGGIRVPLKSYAMPVGGKHV